MPVQQMKKILGILAIVVGFIALVTPFTPGATWLLFIGCQLLGIHFAFWDKLFPNNGHKNGVLNKPLEKSEEQSKIG